MLPKSGPEVNIQPQNVNRPLIKLQQRFERMGALRSLQGSVQPVSDANLSQPYSVADDFNQYKSFSSLSPTAALTPRDTLVQDKTIPTTPIEKVLIEPIEEDDAFANFKNVKKVKRLNLGKMLQKTQFRESRNKEDSLKSVYKKYQQEYSNILN